MIISYHWSGEKKFLTSPFWELNGPYLQNLELLHQRTLYAKFGWNWPHDSGGEDFVNVFWLYKILSPLGKWHGPAFEQTCIRCFMLSLQFWRKRFLIMSIYLKVYIRTNRQTDEGRSETWALFSGELKNHRLSALFKIILYLCSWISFYLTIEHLFFTPWTHKV